MRTLRDGLVRTPEYGDAVSQGGEFGVACFGAWVGGLVDVCAVFFFLALVFDDYEREDGGGFGIMFFFVLLNCEIGVTYEERFLDCLDGLGLLGEFSLLVECGILFGAVSAFFF